MTEGRKQDIWLTDKSNGKRKVPGLKGGEDVFPPYGRVNFRLDLGILVLGSHAFKFLKGWQNLGGGRFTRGKHAPGLYVGRNALNGTKDCSNGGNGPIVRKEKAFPLSVKFFGCSKGAIRVGGWGGGGGEKSSPTRR